MTGLKNAVAIKEQFPKSQVTVLYRDIETYGIAYEDLNAKARKLGIRFIKYSLAKLPKVEPSPDGKAMVRYYDEVFGRESQKAADLVVLATPLVNHPDGMELAKMLRVPLGPERFFFEAHVKLRPVDFATDGIFLAGTAQFPKDIEESVSQALGASARAMTLLRSPKVMSEPIVSYIDPEKCTGCGTCLRVCAYSAISRGADRKAVITASLCKGCGTCVASCPENAIDEYGFSRFQLWSQAMALLGAGGEA